MPQDGHCRHVEFYFQKHEVLLTGGVERTKTHHRAKFRQNRSICCGDIAIFRFLKMAAAAILDLFGAYLDHSRRVLGGLYHCAKFGYDRRSSFDNMDVLIFGTFDWKKPGHAPKIGVWGLFDPTNGL